MHLWELFYTVLFGVSLHRLFGVPSGMNHVAPGCVSMVCRLFMMSGVMMLGSFPVVASGGVGTLHHLVEGATVGGADAVLAASIFHFGEVSVAEAKAYLAAAGVAVRPVTGTKEVGHGG